MIHSRRHMTEDTKQALAKAKRLISKLDYLNFSKAKDIQEEIYQEYRTNEWFEKLTYTDKMDAYLKKRKYEVWVKHLEECKKEER